LPSRRHPSARTVVVGAPVHPLWLTHRVRCREPN
jgi:hypothetical protein